MIRSSYAQRKQRMAAIFTSQSSAERVRDLVEFIYLSENYALSEKLAYALHPAENPYRGAFGEIDGQPWSGQIFCGHNPHLKARLVDDLVIDRDETRPGKGQLERAQKAEPRWSKSIGGRR